MVRQHFNLLLSDSSETNPTSQDDLLSGIRSIISDKENEELGKQISEQEIIEEIWALQPEKSPGPDGFTINFYRASWNIIKDDLRKMLN